MTSVSRALALMLVLSALSGPGLAQTTVTQSPAPQGDTTGAPSISVMVAARKSVSETLAVTGSFAAGANVRVSPLVDGLAVVEILAEEGDTVKEGQVLARLVSRDVDIQLEQNAANLARNDSQIAQAKNQIEQARITRETAETELNRTNRLRRGGISTAQQQTERQSAFDTAVAQQQAAQYSLASAEADKKVIEVQREELELKKARTEIKAPVDGYISRRSVEHGMVSSSQGEPMFEIVAKGLIKLVAEVPEGDLPKLSLGKQAEVSVNGYASPFKGEVALISPTVNEKTRMGSVHIRMAEGTRLPLGAFGRAVITLAADEGISVPMTAVTFGDGGPTVQVVVNGRVEVRKVKTGLVGGEEIEIVDGLAEGESYVARAGSFVRDGDAVNPVPVAANETN